MIKDITATFQHTKLRYSSIVQENYKMKEGLYVRLYIDQSWEDQAPRFENNHLIIRAKEDEPKQNIELLEWIKQQDYKSSLVDMNKSVDPKKQIHSNNPLTLFVKQDVFLGQQKDIKSNMTENIERYLAAASAEQIKQKWDEFIPNTAKSNSNNKVDFFRNSEYASALAYLNSPERTLWIERVTQWYHNNLAQLTEYIGQQTFKHYVKLFFANPSRTTLETHSCETIYAYEYTLYTIPKIYNNNNYNQIVNDQIIGLPSYDMTMNGKKPFLEHKTMRIQAPDRVPLQQALLAKEATDWLATAAPTFSTNKLGYESGLMPSNSSIIEGTLHIYIHGKDKEIHGYENVPFPPKSSFEIEWLNILQLRDKDGDLRDYPPLSHVEILQKEISSKFFRGRMNRQFLFEEPDVKSKEFTAIMVALFLQSRQGFHDWLHKGTTISLRPIFSKVTLRLLEEQLIHIDSARFSDLADGYNLRLSIEILFNQERGRSMADRIQHIVSNLRSKLTAEGTVSCSGDEEFYFIAGQLAYYLMQQSKAVKKTGDVFEPFLRAKNGQQLKKRLEEAFILYKHNISLNHRKFNHAFSMVMGYSPEQVNDGNARELFLAGLFANNLFYESSKGVVLNGEVE